jgi:predicted nucleic acid-binding protein
VVDANVAAKWYMPEPGEASAQDVLESQDVLLAPSIIRLEVLAAIVRCVRDQRSTVAEAELRCNRWHELLDERGLITVQDDQLLADAIRLSLTLKHYLFDCLYLAVCLKYEATLVTFDADLAKKAKAASVRCQLLKEVE